MLFVSGNLFIPTFLTENINWYIVRSFTTVHDDDNPIILRKPFEFSPYNAKGWRLKPSIMHRYLTHQPRRKHAYQLMFALTVWYGGAPSGVLTISVYVKHPIARDADFCSTCNYDIFSVHGAPNNYFSRINHL